MISFKLSFKLNVCLQPLNVKTAEPIGPKFFREPNLILWKVMDG